jgi:hypothetical protein
MDAYVYHSGCRTEGVAMRKPRLRRSHALVAAIVSMILPAMPVAHGASAQVTAVPNPTVVGPIPITPESHPWLSASFPGAPLPDGSLGLSADLAGYGYVEEEFFLEGTARRYSSAGAEIGIQPYTTRIVVRRPADLTLADGTVVLEWNNVTAQFDLEIDWFVSNEHFMRSGHVWIGASVQRVGVQALRAFDPIRYGDLTVGEDPALADAQSWDVFSQVARAIRSPGDVDVLPGFDVERIIATGHSQSAGRLATYYNVIQPQHGLIDGFMIHGASSAIDKSLDLPVMRLLAEGDVSSQAASSEPDADHFRRWEVAGTSHVGFKENSTYFPLLRRDRPAYAPAPCNRPPHSRIPFHYAQNAGYAHLVTWIDEGVAPPTAPRLAWVDPITKARDQHGNQLGGIQLPQHRVATALNDGNNSGGVFCNLRGAHIPFDTETLQALYPTHGTYVSAVNQATTDVFGAGYILEPDADATRRAAATSDYGRRSTL